MAKVIVRIPEARVLEGEEAARFLREQGLECEAWDVSAVPDDLRGYRKLSDEEQQRLLAVWGSRIDELKARNGYTTADVLAVSEETTPNLDTLLDRFRPEHHHTEDEVRFVVSGHGMFGIHQQDPERVYEVHVGPGDLLSVPRGTWHWFDLVEDRRIQCVRLFQDMSGWTPHYREAGAGAAG